MDPASKASPSKTADNFCIRPTSDTGLCNLEIICPYSFSHVISTNLNLITDLLNKNRWAPKMHNFNCLQEKNYRIGSTNISAIWRACVLILPCWEIFLESNGKKEQNTIEKHHKIYVNVKRSKFLTTTSAVRPIPSTHWRHLQNQSCFPRCYTTRHCSYYKWSEKKGIRKLQRPCTCWKTEDRSYSGGGCRYEGKRWSCG